MNVDELTAVVVFASSLIPAVLMPLSVLLYAPILGIFFLMAIIDIILFNGFTKLDSSDSLWSPADTSLGINNFCELGITFGLFMAGVRVLSPVLACVRHDRVWASELTLGASQFSGHAVIPTLAWDMVDPTQCNNLKMINWVFAIAMGIYGLLGVVLV